MAVNGTAQQVSAALGGGQPSFEFMFAPLFIGVIVNALLLGVFIVQVHSYFRLQRASVPTPVFSPPLVTASSDFGWTRYLIYYLILMELINTVCDVGLIYEPLITLYSALFCAPAPSFLAADPVITTLISTPTQLFMAWRIRRLTRSNWLSGLVALLAFASLVGGIAATIAVATHREFAQLAFAEAPLTLWLTSTAFADFFVTTCLVNFLWKKQTGFQTQTDSVTDKIIFFTVQTGMLTSFAAIADVSLFLIFPVRCSLFISMFPKYPPWFDPTIFLSTCFFPIH
ncbi:hypothetical protein C8R44DRAFT_631525 [Mycena epipterygia]|nr:hypothetical protein C8R44DRAFT_631525 [Mycena epipterygia]